MLYCYAGLFLCVVVVGFSFDILSSLLFDNVANTQDPTSPLCPHYLRYCCADSCDFSVIICLLFLRYLFSALTQVAASRPCPRRGVLLLQRPLEEPLGEVRVPSGGPPIRQVCHRERVTRRRMIRVEDVSVGLGHEACVHGASRLQLVTKLGQQLRARDAVVGLCPEVFDGQYNGHRHYSEQGYLGFSIEVGTRAQMFDRQYTGHR